MCAGKTRAGGFYMKKVVALILALVSLLTLVSCGSEFPPVESTEREAKTVMTLSYDGEEYEVPYELYRAFFLTYKSEVDGGNEAVWSGPESAEYVAKINAMVLNSITEMYAAFYLCDRIGTDVFSSSFDDEIEAYIEESVENIIYVTELEAKKRGENIEVSREEAYQIYLARLKASGLNYSVSILLYRYNIALSKIDEYYRGKPDSSSITGYEGGKVDTSRDTVKAFYDSADTIKLMYFCLQDDVDSQRRVDNAREDMLEASSRDELVAAIVGNLAYGYPETVEQGMTIGKYSLSTQFTDFEKFADAAFALDIGEISETVEVYDGARTFIYVLYRDEKTDAHFDKSFTDIASSHVSNEIGKIKHQVKSGLKSSCEYSSFYGTLNHASISISEEN